LYDLLYNIVAEGFTMRDDWSNVTVDARQGWASSCKDDSEDFVGLVDHRDYSTMQHRTHQNLGPDMCFLVLSLSNPKPGPISKKPSTRFSLVCTDESIMGDNMLLDQYICGPKVRTERLLKDI
jgi:hypothetical protein